MISRRPRFWFLLVLTAFLIAACSDTSSTLGQFHQGRILVVNVVEMVNTDELRYSNGPDEMLSRWRIQPSGEGQELLLMRIKVENHIAVSAVFVADAQAAVIRGFFQNEYRPINVADTAYRDWRGLGDALVTEDEGMCGGNSRLVVNAGSSVQWMNGGGTGASIQFSSGVIPQLGDGLVEIAPGGSVSHRFDQPGTFDYQCTSEIDFPIESIDDAGDGDLIVTTAGAHGLVAGDSISQTNMSNTDYLGNFEVKTVPSPNAYTVAAPFFDTDTGAVVVVRSQSMQVLVEAADSVRDKKERQILFLAGNFELLRGTGVDGWMVFDVPIDTKIRDLRWRAGDNITIHF